MNNNSMNNNNTSNNKNNNEPNNLLLNNNLFIILIVLFIISFIINIGLLLAFINQNNDDFEEKKLNKYDEELFNKYDILEKKYFNLLIDYEELKKNEIINISNKDNLEYYYEDNYYNNLKENYFNAKIIDINCECEGCNDWIIDESNIEKCYFIKERYINKTINIKCNNNLKSLKECGNNEFNFLSLKLTQNESTKPLFSFMGDEYLQCNLGNRINQNINYAYCIGEYYLTMPALIDDNGNVINPKEYIYFVSEITLAEI
jgi:hypothetical protein